MPGILPTATVSLKTNAPMTVAAAKGEDCCADENSGQRNVGSLCGGYKKILSTIVDRIIGAREET